MAGWIVLALQISSAVLAFAAAYLWIKSTKIALPAQVTWLAMDGGHLPGLNMVLGGGRAMPVVSNGFDELVIALKAQSRLSAYAAYAAAGAAVLQGVAALIPQH